MKIRKYMSWMLIVIVGTVIAFTVFFQNIEEAKPQENLGADLLPQTLLDPSDRKLSSSILKDKYVGLYFSASWCGPCRSFNPELIKFRNQHQEKFEVVLIGGDGSPKAQSKYMKEYEMPWLAMENQSDAAKTASEKLKVQYIPYLVILDPEGNVVSKDGVSEIRAKGNDALNSWIQ